MSWIRRTATFFLLFFLSASLVWAESLRVHQEKYAKFQKQYDAQIEKLATWCHERGLTEEETQTRQLNHTPYDEDRVFVARLPQEVQSEELASSDQVSRRSTKKKQKNAEEKPSKKSKQNVRTDLPSEAQPDSDSSSDSSSDSESETSQEQWRKSFNRLRLSASNHLFKLSCQAMEDRHATYAFELLMRTLEENPDHAAARQILGYERVGDLWLSEFEKKQSETMVFHPQFGWISPKFVERYENGERNVNGRWVSAKQDAALHFDIENGWTVETPHFTIVTNHSLPAAVRIGEEVEVLYRVWKQLFLRYFATDAQLKTLFVGRSAARNRSGALSTSFGSGTHGKHRVVFFRNQDNYVQYLSPKYPNVVQSCGFYIIEDQTSYFFAGEKFDRATLLHEVTHQLFNEERRTSPEIALRPNFWMIEGIATYMESLHDEGRYHVVGGFETERLLAARIRFTRDHFYVPLAELSAMNAAEFQSHPEMSRLYSQASALTQFLLHAGNGQYRDAVVDILHDIYTGQASKNTIPRYLGCSFEELDEEYRTYISRNQEELRKWEVGGNPASNAEGSSGENSGGSGPEDFGISTPE